VAILGCGDRDFEHFCGALNVIWEKLEKTGAKELLNPLRLNRYFMDEMGNQERVRDWAGQVAEKLKHND
jgi:flavodoxin